MTLFSVLYKSRGVIALAFAFVCAFSCFSPLFHNDIFSSFAKDGIFSGRLPSSILNIRTSLSASLFIVIVPLVDIGCDIPFYVMDYFLLHKKNIRTVSVICLTDIERLLIIIGIGIQSTTSFLPKETDLHTMGIIYTLSNYCSCILVAVPVLVYLNRVTTSVTTLVLIITVTGCLVGYMLFSYSFFLDGNPEAYGVVVIAGAISLFIAIFFTVYAAAKSFGKFVYLKAGTKTARKIHYEWFQNLKNLSYYELKKGISNNPEMYDTYVPALHMLAGCILIAGNLYTGFLPQYTSATNYDYKNYVVIFAETMILVMEFRIRKSEMEKGLRIALVNSKNTYVRYISHELRTPLNTAYLGLKLLTEEFKASTNVKDMKRYDTLFDVNRSCEAAIDILNDLLCYEKIESSILVLHKEEITVQPYLFDCLSMFNVQARECGVTMCIHTGVTDAQCQADRDSECQVTLPLQPYDTVLIDKFKMNQVIRNLISNALKFTPTGGNVIMQAVFIHDVEEEGEGLNDLDGVARTVVPYVKSPARFVLDSIRHVQIYPVSEETNKQSNVGNSDNSTAIAGHLVLTVTDTGVGMSANNQKRLFKEIIQFDPEKLQAGGGSGLGLWITSGIIDLHDGQIRVASDGEGKGCSFTVSIPMTRYPSRASMTSPQSLLPSLASITYPQSLLPSIGEVLDCFGEGYELPPLSPRIFELPVIGITPRREILSSPRFEVLVVDDSNLNRKMLIRCLEAEQYVCEYACDGLEAIEKVEMRMGWNNYSNNEGGLRRRPYDVILMDFVMPLMDGPAATELLRTMGYNGAIFGVTGNGITSDVEHFLSCGADKVFLKPLDMIAFGTAMKEKLMS